jgi:hypothetical protein
MYVPRPAAPPALIVYLDLDGVLHHEEVLWSSKKGIYMCPKLAPGRVLFEWLPYLENVLKEFPEVELVLSSSWCIRPGYGDTMKRFPPEIQRRFVGGTYHSRIHGADAWALVKFLELPRGIQVWNDVQRRNPKRWLAIDDTDEGWPELAVDNLIRCDGATGLSSPRVQTELQQKLEQCRQALRFK